MKKLMMNSMFSAVMLGVCGTDVMASYEKEVPQELYALAQKTSVLGIAPIDLTSPYLANDEGAQIYRSKMNEILQEDPQEIERRVVHSRKLERELEKQTDEIEKSAPKRMDDILSPAKAFEARNEILIQKLLSHEITIEEFQAASGQ